MTSLQQSLASPVSGHSQGKDIERAKRIYGFIGKFKVAATRVRTGVPDYSNLTYLEQDWESSVYGGGQEELPHNMPEPLGKIVRITEYVDANLYFDLVTGRACTGILIFANQTPVEWYSKKQSTVATATFGSEFVGAKTATEKAYDIRYTLRMLGVPVDYRTYMFGDNLAVITQGTLPHSQLSKRHNALAYHYVREAVATGMLRLFHMPGVDNPADALTKHLGFQQWNPILKPILFWCGDTAAVPHKGE